MFGRATIRLGIGPHSSLQYIESENSGVVVTTIKTIWQHWKETSER